MIFSQRKFTIWHIAALFSLISCQTMSVQNSVPAWVIDYNKVYPERDWVCVVESAQNRQQAQAAASSSLAGTFKVDVQSLTTAAQNFSRTVSNGESQILQADGFGRQVNATSDITGLMGVITEYWTDPKSGAVYVNARMNRVEGAATYSAIIKGNDNAITALKKEAANNPATFDAFESLCVAADLATLTDNYLNILSVLNSSARQSLSVSYGNAAAVEILRQQAARAIVITVKINGDVNSRIAKAFGTVFSSRGFRTSAENSVNPYVLQADFNIEELELKAGGNSFVRYELTAALLNADGVEVFSFSENDRQGHINMSEARQRAIRAAEDAITGEGFAAAFDKYLASLLK
jgi:hypothetical protein